MSQDTFRADWIAASFDGCQLRAWPMQGGDPLQMLSCPSGPAGVVADLVSLTSSWLTPAPLPVVLSGDTEIRPIQVPCKPLDLRPRTDTDRHTRIVLHALPGLSQSAPCAIMHNAAIRVAGFLSLNTDWDGVICLPGAQTHWAQISAGEVVSFQSFLTLSTLGAMAELPGLEAAFSDADWDRDTLADAVSDAMSKPERLAARMAEVQADMALNAPAPAHSHARLMGLLIGAELAAARPYWLGQNLAVIGDDTQSAPYAAALGQQGVAATIADAQRMTLAGLTAAWRRLGT
ncbi:2-dehydro-3-deoxygalactonokinase [Aliisedimentitalea scapharcae]|uniref:2-dehydro-3-deoxygalactonokinase n=1 Tax=Aliisedimentitalea scapharcae TaxID=1524259 RepID=A0ABZ2XV76_9RHOB